MNFSSPLTVLYNRETRVETCFERVPAPTQSVWVADCYFIVNVLDLPFASPVAIYR